VVIGMAPFRFSRRWPRPPSRRHRRGAAQIGLWKAGPVIRASAARPLGSGARRRPRRFWVYLLIPLIICTWCVLALERNLSPLVLKIADVRAQAWAIQTISRVINEEIIPGLTYESLIRLERDNNGRIAFMQPDNLEINRVMAKAVAAIQSELRHSEEFVVMVPLNQALGTELFMNVGPRIPAYVTAVGTVSGELSEEFSEAGINQTRHVIYLDIRTQMHIVVPFVRSTSTVSTRLSLAQAVIVGDVPHTYVRIGP